MKSYIFHRGSTWYPIYLYDDEDAIKNALHNIGTTKVTDTNGKVIWKLSNQNKKFKVSRNKPKP